MSIDEQVKRLQFKAAEPEIEDISHYVLLVLDGEHAASACVALVRVMAHLICQGEEPARTEMVGAVIDALRQRVRMGGEL